MTGIHARLNRIENLLHMSSQLANLEKKIDEMKNMLRILIETNGPKKRRRKNNRSHDWCTLTEENKIRYLDDELCSYFDGGSSGK